MDETERDRYADILRLQLWLNTIPRSIVYGLIAILGITIIVGATTASNPFAILLYSFVGGLSTVFGATQLTRTLRLYAYMRYMPDMLDRVRANTVELATWLSTDPQYGTIDTDRHAQQEIGMFLHVHADELSRTVLESVDQQDELIKLLANRMAALAPARLLVDTYLEFTRLMQHHPNHYETIDNAYRNVMRCISTGEDMTGKTVSVKLSNHQEIILTLDKGHER